MHDELHRAPQCRTNSPWDFAVSAGAHLQNIPCLGRDICVPREVRAQSHYHRTYFSRTDVEYILEQVGDQYGRWQDRECRNLKHTLLSLEDRSIDLAKISSYPVHLFQSRFGETQSFKLCSPPFLVDIMTLMQLKLNLFWVELLDCSNSKVYAGLSLEQEIAKEVLRITDDNDTLNGFLN